MTTENGKRTLPLVPHPEHLRKQAKARFAELKTRDPSVRLADAQFLLAREYGFAGWSQMMAEVMKRGEGPRSRAASFTRWRLRSRFEPDAEQETHAAFFRVGAAAHVGFFLTAAAGLGMVLLTPGAIHLAQLIRATL